MGLSDSWQQQEKQSVSHSFPPFYPTISIFFKRPEFILRFFQLLEISGFFSRGLLLLSAHIHNQVLSLYCKAPVFLLFFFQSTPICNQKAALSISSQLSLPAIHFNALPSLSFYNTIPIELHQFFQNYNLYNPQLATPISK